MLNNDRIIDCFMLGSLHELDLLELRLQYLNEIVDYFVIVESKFTFTKKEKELFFEQNKDKFKKYLDKIVYVVVDKTVGGTWDNEHHQRNSVVEGLLRISIKNNDIIILSDLDEIPNIEAIRYYSNNNIQTFKQAALDYYFYFLNWKSNWVSNGCQFQRGKYYLDGGTPQELRSQRKNKKTVLPVHGGWHFTYMGGANGFLTKVSANSNGYVHWDKTEDDINNLINQMVYKQRDIEIPLYKINIHNEKNYPNIIRERYKELLNLNLIQE